jgi:hypothetical protein
MRIVSLLGDFCTLLIGLFHLLNSCSKQGDNNIGQSLQRVSNAGAKQIDEVKSNL